MPNFPKQNCELFGKMYFTNGSKLLNRKQTLRFRNVRSGKINLVSLKWHVLIWVGVCKIEDVDCISDWWYHLSKLQDDVNNNKVAVVLRKIWKSILKIWFYTMFVWNNLNVLNNFKPSKEILKIGKARRKSNPTDHCTCFELLFNYVGGKK